jgi:hypothetical protein
MKRRMWGSDGVKGHGGYSKTIALNVNNSVPKENFGFMVSHSGYMPPPKEAIHRLTFWRV